MCAIECLVLVHIAHSRNTHITIEMASNLLAKHFHLLNRVIYAQRKYVMLFAITANVNRHLDTHTHISHRTSHIAHTQPHTRRQWKCKTYGRIILCLPFLFVSFCCRCIKCFVPFHNATQRRTCAHTCMGTIVEKFFPFVAGDRDKMKIIINTEDNSSQKLCFGAIISTLSWCGRDTFVETNENNKEIS